jgi:hypothetical protein
MVDSGDRSGRPPSGVQDTGRGDAQVAGGGMQRGKSDHLIRSLKTALRTELIYIAGPER